MAPKHEHVCQVQRECQQNCGQWFQKTCTALSEKYNKNYADVITSQLMYRCIDREDKLENFSSSSDYDFAEGKRKNKDSSLKS